MGFALFDIYHVIDFIIYQFSLRVLSNKVKVGQLEDKTTASKESK